ncbi:MAG: hypothetical protein HUJ80_00095, partial [Firmicutes bacterium]|nr:hypothetical protein [Bacillota bacterium]
RLSKDGKEQPWNHSFGAADSFAGIYYHDQLLSAGTYRLSGSFRTHGSASLFIDDLTLTYLSPSAGLPLEGAVQADRQWQIQYGEGGKNHITGSFTLPESPVAYESHRDTLCFTTIADNPYATVSSGRGLTQQILKVDVPEGYAAPLLKIQTKSSYSSDPDTPIRFKGSFTGTVAGVAEPSFGLSVDTREPSGIYTRREPGFVITAAGLSAGRLTVEARKGSSSDSCTIPSMRMYLVPASASKALTEGPVFEAGGTVYFLNRTASDRRTLSFASPQEGSVTISNFRLYTVEKGSKVYPEPLYTAKTAGLTGWQKNGASAALLTAEEAPSPEESRVYKKGETVGYQFTYWDYEDDPEKAGYWVYTHEPLNDGENPIAGQILTSPVSRFYIDGKYTVEHWAIDDADRGKGPDGYDLESNHAFAVFYVIGEADKENRPPRIESIRTDPAKVSEGDEYDLIVRINDDEKDILDLKVEVYYEDEAKPFYTGEKQNIRPGSSGVYPAQTFTGLPAAKEGVYEVVATVSDGESSAVKSYRFTVIAARRLAGMVDHTDAWETNRQTYNFNHFKDRGASYFVSDFAKYKAAKLPRKRGTNVFWPGEALQLSAETEGPVISVTASIEGTSYNTVLKKLTSSENKGTVITRFGGQLWNKAMAEEFAKAGPEQKTVLFTAEYEGGVRLYHRVTVIFDGDDPYWLLHRAY